MKIQKKLLPLLLALVLCISTLAACSNEPAETTTGATDGSTAPVETTASTETTKAALLTNTDIYPVDFDGTLTCATSRQNASESAYWLMWEEVTGVDIDWVHTAEEQTPLLFLDEKQMPDILFQANGLSLSQINEYGKGGLLINYMDHLDKMPNLAARYSEDSKLFDAVKDADGNVYTLPYYCKDYTMAGNLFYIRLDHTAAAGWKDLPTTIEDFLLMCEDLQNYYANVDGYVPVAVNGSNHMGYNHNVSKFFFPAFGELMQPGIGTNDEATTIAIGFATEQFKHYITFMHTLYAEGYLDPDCFVNESATTKAMTNEGKVTMHNHATQLTTDNFDSGTLDFQVMPALTSQYQSEARWALPNNYMEGRYMISSTCSNLDAALAFMDALYSIQEDPLNKEGTIWGASLCNGELGVHFTVDEESGTYTSIIPEGYDSASAWGHVAGSGSAAYVDWPYIENSGSGLMVKSLGSRDILEPDGVEVFYTQMLQLTQEEQDAYNDIWIDINNKVTEMNAAFITGQADIEAEWDAYVNELYNLGLQDVIDVYQAALDRYNAG